MARAWQEHVKGMARACQGAWQEHVQGMAALAAVAIFGGRVCDKLMLIASAIVLLWCRAGTWERRGVCAQGRCSQMSQGVRRRATRSAGCSERRRRHDARVRPLAAAQGEAKAKATCRCQLSLLAQVASQNIHAASNRGSRSRRRDWQGRGVRRASRTPQWAP